MKAFLPESEQAKSPTEEEKKSSSKKSVPLIRSILRTFAYEIFCVCSFKIAGDLLSFVHPKLLGSLIDFIANKEEYRRWHGYALVAAFLLSSLIISMSYNQTYYHVHNFGMRLRTALLATVYRKALFMNNETRRQFTTGAIVNFMSIDCQRVQNVTLNSWLMLSVPLQIILSFYFLNDLLGLSFLVGVGVLVVLIPINTRISFMERRYQTDHLTYKDRRLKMMNELLNGIKVIKLSAWEDAFYNIVRASGNDEIACLRKAVILVTIIIFNWICSPILVTTGTLLTYTFVSDKHYLDPTTAFVALSLFNMLRHPMNALPGWISEVMQSLVSIKRLRNFLSCEELDPDDVSHVTKEGVAASIENGTFTWDKKEKPTLKDINLEVKEGQLVAVIGPVGAGKSSLISSLLGEMRRLEGHVAMKGTVAYVSQQAWIQNRSLKDGVIFDNKEDKKLYEKVIHACALKADLDMFAAGDQTEIGEKGINLSGGQKLRVTLARAVYYNADVYLLDDPLSAVDTHVGKHIFKEVIGPTGMLQKKTRVMVTHGVNWLPACDVIVVMDNGRIAHTGTYQELASKGILTNFASLDLHLEDTLPVKSEFPDEKYVSVESLCSQTTLMSQEFESADINPSENSKRQKMFKLTRFPFFRKKKNEKDKEQNGKIISEKPVQGQQLVEEEEYETGKIKGHVVKALLKAFGPIPFAVAMVIVLVHNAIELAANFWLTNWTSDSYLSNTSLFNTSEYTDRTVTYVSVYAVFGILQAIVMLFFVGIIFLRMLVASKDMHNAMLRAILHQPMSFFDTTPLGRILNRFSRDVDALDGSLAHLIRMYCIQIFHVINVLFIITYTTPVFLAAAVPLIFFYFVMQTLYVPSSRQLRRFDSISRSPIYVHFNETISGATCIRAFGATERFIVQNEKLVDNNNVYIYANVSSWRWLKIRLELIGNLTSVFAALFTIMADDLSASLAGLSVSYALQITGSLNMLVGHAVQLETNAVSAERIVGYSSLPPEPDWVVEDTRPKEGWPQNGVISFHDYSTRYRPGLDLVLQSVTAHIRSGEKVGIVGRTGAGKSSLSLSLFRLIEAAEGKILIDDIDIASMGLHDLRSRLTILPQDPVLFSGTLRFNLDPLSEFTDEQLWSALGQSHLKTYVESLSKGLEHEVDEGGINLSVGQRQLVCLARALLRKTRVLVLDEATAAVDMETDELIQRTIRSAFKECTVLTIAHRLHTVLDYDRILILSNGTVLEFDSPENLLKDTNSTFYKMAREANLVA
ncbi:LOW QUALITY PROTEIN: canalicular multispecific organic anion transporter 2-like [Pomacea canaliculata]|uniref:LOW QUALITY PROTEIN: canalicular multispecific organic anion transporter 2-like n=1 Tax=Pomacea canaliculata TaxID=400727 RepID=UPI000D73CAE7|nr:LOW QUALITY PROTEIN: canalicular multispecific organic anion transporter 2-like [Pomacea canaliculata]